MKLVKNKQSVEYTQLSNKLARCPRKMVKIVVDDDKCIGCGVCVEVKRHSLTA